MNRKEIRTLLVSFAASLLVVVWLVLTPVTHQIDTVMEATEYSFADPDYAEIHTMTIRGRDTRSALGKGRFEGVVAAEGWELAEPGWTVRAKYPMPDDYMNVVAEDPFFRLMSANVMTLVSDRKWSAFVVLLQEIEDREDGRYGFFDSDAAHFIVSGTLPREEALAVAQSLTRGTAAEALFNRP